LGGVKSLPDNPTRILFANDRFGDSVDISGDIIVVGLPGKDRSGPSSDWGEIWVFERNNGGSDFWGRISSVISNNLQWSPCW